MSSQATSSYRTGWWQMKDAMFLLPEIHVKLEDKILAAVIKLTELGQWPRPVLKNLRFHLFFTYKRINSVALVRKRPTPTKRPPLVGELSANCCG
jgi:hypothetical protein